MATTNLSSTASLPCPAATGTERRLLNGAVAAHRAGRMGEAERLYRESLRNEGVSAEGLHGLGLVAQQAGDLEAAERLMRAAVEIGQNDPRDSVYRSSLGNVLQIRGKLADAVKEYEVALALRPDSGAALSNLGTALLALGRPEVAVGRLRRAAELMPDSGQVADNLGNALQAVGRLEEAVRWHERALEAMPWSVEAHGNLGLALAGMGRWAEALDSFGRGLTIDSGNARIGLARAQLQLLLGDFANGLRDYEWRKRLQVGRNLPGREWRGETLLGETLLIYAEQGLGDTIQTLRYLPAVRERAGAGVVVVEVQQVLFRLAVEFARDLPGVRVVAVGDGQPEAEWQCSLMSLPLVMWGVERRGNSWLGAEAVPYLAALRETLKGMRGSAEAGTMRVGLVWAGNRAHARDRFRSIAFSRMEALLEIEGVVFHSLQMGDAAAEARGRLVELPAVEDMAETAAVIAGLDLVIGVDTAVVHLAGAMGKPVWTLLPFWPDWRWGLERQECEWYPTMRLFRQREPGDWAGVIEAVRSALAMEAAGFRQGL